MIGCGKYTHGVLFTNYSFMLTARVLLFLYQGEKADLEIIKRGGKK